MLSLVMARREFDLALARHQLLVSVSWLQILLFFLALVDLAQVHAMRTRGLL